MRRPRPSVPFSALALLLALRGAPAGAEEPVDFSAEIQPIFNASCGGCHVGSSTSGVELTDHAKVLASVGALYGRAVVQPGDAFASPLWDKVARLAPRHGSRCPVVVDVSDPKAPRVVGSLGGMDAVDVAPYAHYQIGSGFAVRAYIADPDYGVRIADLLPEPSSPRLAGGVEMPGAAGLDTYTRYVETDGATPSREHDYLYVAAGEAGLRVIDITDPAAPRVVASLALGGRAAGVDVASQMKPPGVDDYALVANAELGPQLVDVTSPQKPVLLKTLEPPGSSSTRAFIEVQQMDRFIDEDGNILKEISHPGAGHLSRADIVRILKAEIGR